MIGLAISVFCSGVLGVTGWLTPGAYVALLAALFLASLFLRTSGSLSMPPSSTLDIRLPIVAAGVALTVLVIANGLVHSPATAYDSLSYHLFFPARWIQDHHLSIIPTPFSDEAQAYAPANGELYLASLMLPLHGDLLARIGQIPFELLTGVALYALAVQAGARREHAGYVGLFAIAGRLVVEQASGADVDLICWFLFLAAIYLGLRALASDARRDWILFGVTLGLHFGTKYVTLIYAPVFLLLIFSRGLRARALWAIPGLAAFALPWYLRNWIVAGSPIYPSSLALAGVTIARGAYTRAAMLNSIFHTTDWRLLPVMAGRTFGPTLLVAWLILAPVGIWRMARRQPRWPAMFLVLLPALMLPLYWFGVPDNVDSRFLLPAVLLALVPLAFTFGTSSAWNTAVHALYAIAVVWILVGVNAEIPADVPWYMGGWLNLWGLLASSAWWIALGLALGASLLWWLLRRAPSRLVMTAGAAVLVAAIIARGATRSCGEAPCEYLQLTSIFLRQSMIEAWRWMDANVSGATVAYSGNNVPYLLAGPRLNNRVYYVNTDNHPGWRLHDYDRAMRQGQPLAADPPLATSSGVLRPLASPSGAIDAVRPRYARLGGNRDAWIRNLRALKIDHLFVSALSAYEIDYVWHNAGGFPIEDEWARTDPQRFPLLYENSQVRVYGVRTQGAAQ